MNDLPFQLVPISETRKQFYRRWTSERLLDLELRGKNSAQIREIPAKPLELVNPCDKVVKPGQVRLLDDEMHDGSVFFRYVCVLEETPEGTCLCVPFSPYSEPATKDEWRTPHEGSPVKVMQLWNTHEIPVKDLASHSWSVFVVDQAVLEGARTLYTCFVTGTWPPMELRDQTGTPIFKPSDIRIEYQREEQASFFILDEKLEAFYDEVEAWNERCKERFAVESWDGKVALAAGGVRFKNAARMIRGSAETWVGFAEQTEDFTANGVFEQRYTIQNPPAQMRPGLPVFIQIDESLIRKAFTRLKGDLIILREKDPATIDKIKSRKKFHKILVVES